jgi:hypothetical protein
MKQKRSSKVRMGRPPRPDKPEAVTLLMAVGLKRLLRAQAEREGRSMGLLVEDAVRRYVAAKRRRAR